jgi:purine nucleosidase
MPRRIVLDTDMGSDVDDALCLALALASPEVDLVAVTHVSRDTQTRARISRRLLDLAGRGDVPVYAGCSAPLAGAEGRFVWFGNEGKGILDGHPDQPLPEENAVDALPRLFASESGLELVAVGPMTNVAAALDRDPGFANNIAQLTIMGGHIRKIEYGGQTLPFGVDYNLCSDPEASVKVLSASIPTRLVTGDVTLQTWFTEVDVHALEARETPLLDALGKAIRHWTPIMKKLFGRGPAAKIDNAAFLHDPLALASVWDESFCTFEALAIEPTIEDGLFRTVERPTGAPGSFPMRCATAVDGVRFREYLRDRLLTL